jgi:hypothetical protein
MVLGRFRRQRIDVLLIDAVDPEGIGPGAGPAVTPGSPENRGAA